LEFRTNPPTDAELQKRDAIYAAVGEDGKVIPNVYEHPAMVQIQEEFTDWDDAENRKNPPYDLPLFFVKTEELFEEVKK